MEKIHWETEDIYYGGAAHRPAEIIVLKAGPLHCQYEGGHLRYIKAGDTELVRMIYPAVRDHNWGTVLPEISHEQVVQGEDHFEIHYDARYQEREIDFQAHFHIQGDTKGDIRVAMQGEALSTFRKNRIGFNILHPPQASAASCIVQHTDGSVEKGFFPKYISPHQPFMDMKSIRWQIEDIGASLAFEGDIFEMEDQRNWTDASFKTYNTPLGIPFPVTIKKGEKIFQAVHLSVDQGKSQPQEREKPLSFSLGKESYALPDIGVGQSSEIHALTTTDLKHLQAIRFSHYRADVRLYAQNAAQQWERALHESRQLHLPLELALHFGEDVEEEVRQFQILVAKDRPDLKHLLLFSTKHKATPKELLQYTVPRLRKLFPDTRIGAGTDCFFTELNRHRVPTEGIDFLTYSLNPQVHQFDNQSLVETLEAQGFTVDSARQFSDKLPIHVSPVTLKMRFNPNATGPEPETPADQLPPQVDTRQISLFGAGWTLGSIKYLAERSLSAVTYFETLGRRGLMQGAHTPLLDDQCKVEKGMLYPMYWIFYWLLQHASVRVMQTQSSDPLQIEGLAWEAQGECMLMLANLQPETLEVELKGWKDWYAMKVMDAQHFGFATQDPDTFLSLSCQLTGNKIVLSPYAVCFLK